MMSEKPASDKNHNPRKGTEIRHIRRKIRRRRVDKNHNPRKGTEILTLSYYHSSLIFDKNHNPRKGTEIILEKILYRVSMYFR